MSKSSKDPTKRVRKFFLLFSVSLFLCCLIWLRFSLTALSQTHIILENGADIAQGPPLPISPTISPTTSPSPEPKSSPPFPDKVYKVALEKAEAKMESPQVFGERKFNTSYHEHKKIRLSHSENLKFIETDAPKDSKLEVTFDFSSYEIDELNIKIDAKLLPHPVVSIGKIIAELANREVNIQQAFGKARLGISIKNNLQSDTECVGEVGLFMPAVKNCTHWEKVLKVDKLPDQKLVMEVENQEAYFPAEVSVVVNGVKTKTGPRKGITYTTDFNPIHRLKPWGVQVFASDNLSKTLLKAFLYEELLNEDVYIVKVGGSFSYKLRIGQYDDKALADKKSTRLRKTFASLNQEKGHLAASFPKIFP